MLAFLTMAAIGMEPAQAGFGHCEHLNEGRVSSLVGRVQSSIDLNPTAGTRVLADLVRYWKRVCPDERYNASKRLVKEMSGLLKRQGAIFITSSMMIDVGPNLKASARQINSSIIYQKALEDSQMQLSGPVMPETGRILSYSLLCVKRKMETGTISQKYCSYIKAAGY